MPEPTVTFIGAGPGAPDLITLRGKQILERADVVVWADSLVNPDILAWARPDAEIHASASMTLEEQAAVMVAAAQAGRLVARLHTGDPSFYGAIHEQMRALDAAGVAYAVVPGVSSVSAAAAALSAELTVPEVSQTVILTRAAGRTPVPELEALPGLAAHQATMALFLSAGLVDGAVADLLAGGYPPDTPSAAVYRASWPDEQILRAPLRDLPEALRAAGIRQQALLLVGKALASRVGRGRAAGTRSRLYDPTFTHGLRSGQDDPGGWGASDSSAADAPPASCTSERAAAILALTRPALPGAARLAAVLPGSTLFVPARYLAEAGAGAQAYGEPLAPWLRARFRDHGAWICFGAIGAIVRMLAPVLGDKHTDPAVVALDAAGRFAVSVLSGHRGGANALAAEVARVLGAQAVITTASEATDTLAVDLLGAEFGWRIEGEQHLTALSALVVNGEPVGIFQDAGERGWWPAGRPLPGNIRRLSRWEDVAGGGLAGYLVITDRLLTEGEVAAPAVVYRPPSLVVGVGCRRGTAADAIEDAVCVTLAEAGLSFASACEVATAERKRGEAGLTAFAERHGLPVRYYPEPELAAVPAPTPSEYVAGVLGTPGVCEPAALLASGRGELVVTKRRFPSVTVAVARKREEA